jgi:hypothetical protein
MNKEDNFEEKYSKKIREMISLCRISFGFMKLSIIPVINDNDL